MAYDKNFSVIIVAFEPDLSVLNDNIKIIETTGGNAIVVDNSIVNKLEPKNISEKSILISLGGNYGIAYAQNVGIKKAIEIESKAIIFLDQDSETTEELINGLLESLSDDVDIVAPLSLDKENNVEYPNHMISPRGFTKTVYSNGRTEMYKVDIVISSGMCIKSEVIDKVGYLDEDFFIDFVDIEYCYRCKKNNIDVWVNPLLKLAHKIGVADKRIGLMKVNVHGPYRTYYKVRNTYLLRKKGFKFIYCLRTKSSAIIKNFFLIFKRGKGKEYRHYYFSGIKDGIRKRTGSYESNHPKKK